MLHGGSLIDGTWHSTGPRFTNAPVDGAPDTFHAPGAADLDQAVVAAEAAFATYGRLPGSARARFLRRIATELEARGAALTEIGTRETGLPAARLEGERGRTVGQLRMFADLVARGDDLMPRHVPADASRTPPRPDQQLLHRPIGPVAVFAASNFPLAFSVAGGDTASALAAGCPVVFRAHSAHPGTSEVAAQAIQAAIVAEGLPGGVFSLLQAGSREIATALVQHPLINAVGFTGSLGGGRALFDLCHRRPMPIPFFGELGSVNPVYVFEAAASARAAGIASGWVASLGLGAGQFCTNPGIIVLPDRDDVVATFTQAAIAAAKDTAPQTMLTERIASAYHTGVAHLARLAEQVYGNTDGTGRSADMALFQCSDAELIDTPALAEEVFGAAGLIVRASGTDAFARIAAALPGQLTATLHRDPADHAAAEALLPLLARKAGRVLFNGFPTGVDVSAAMVHGGPYPASTNFGATSVGELSIHRWLRPVCFQDMGAPAQDILILPDPNQSEAPQR
ncbi:aldehyde dehydrogenase (NADP(+)) [Epibacterium sp. Ofav1-8]|uniref:aldehyde dehydrogenase (NADP(+)) n=1 Tax=Epibacterium sp. Ofav1-8 TaxID=2917735 RepID=UPI00351D46B9